jgi:hypothetical protein
VQTNVQLDLTQIAEPRLRPAASAADAHHLRFAQSPALGRKVSDEFTVPLCRGHHREVHRCGDEANWWSNAGVDPTVTARALWLQTHPLPAASKKMRIEGANSLAAVEKTGVVSRGFFAGAKPVDNTEKTGNRDISNKNRDTD